MQKFIVYQTTNKINGKIYVGYHKTESNKFDGYFGSGQIIRHAIKKYGVDNFQRETLFEYYDEADARQKEKEIVTQEFLQRKDVYNISLGGQGGNTLAGYSDEERLAIVSKITEAQKHSREARMEMNNGRYHSDESRAKMSAKRTADMENGLNHTIPDNKGRVHSEKSRNNFTEAGLKRRGTLIYINDGKTTVPHKASEVIPEGWVEGFGPDRVRLESHREETKSKISESKKGALRYTNGILNLNFRPGDDIPEGFYRGITKHSKERKLWITNGTIATRINHTDSLPDGFVYGRKVKNEK